MGKLQDRVALITGAAAGIGRETALIVAREGAKVVLSDIQEERGKEVAQEIRKNGGEALFFAADVSKPEEVEHLVETAIKRFGKLDYACNNAGIENKATPTADIEQSDWDRTMAINLTGVWLCMKHEINYMQKAGSGSIVNMSSVAGLVGFQGVGAYTASKHGVVGLTRAAALDYAQSGIRVNAVCPGVIKTEMIQRFTQGNPEAEQGLLSLEPIGRLGTPAEIGQAVVWLFSDDSSFVTGQAIPVDGGLTTK